jgi:transcriptional regulator with XRE-family HTH domain
VTEGFRNEVEGRWAELGEFIRAQRQFAQLSVRRLAELAEISNPYLSQIERGLRRPSADILQQIAKALRLNTESLYVRAGILDDEADGAAPSVVEAIHADKDLTDVQKAALLEVYDGFRRAAAATTSASRLPTAAASSSEEVPA